MVLVKRIWSKTSQISEHTELLDIWDTGSHIFERWPNGNEFYWRIVSREEFNNGFIEILEKQPPWQVPSQVLRREQIPLLQMSVSQFQMGEWNVEQVVENASSMKEEHSAQVHKAHRPQAHNYKKNTSSQRQQIPRVQQTKSQVQTSMT